MQEKTIVIIINNSAQSKKRILKSDSELWSSAVQFFTETTKSTIL